MSQGALQRVRGQTLNRARVSCQLGQCDPLPCLQGSDLLKDLQPPESRRSIAREGVSKQDTLFGTHPFTFARKDSSSRVYG